MKTLKKLHMILTKKEINGILLLSFGYFFLSLSEAFGIGIMIPIMNLYLNFDKIGSSRIFIRFSQLTGISNTVTFFSLLIAAALTLFVAKAFYSLFILYLQQRFVSGVYSRLSSNILTLYLAKPYEFHLENNSTILFKNIITEVGLLTQSFLTPLILIGSEIMNIIVIFSLLAYFYPMMAFSIFIVFCMVTIIMNTFFKKKIKEYSIIREKYSEQLHKDTLQSLQAIKEIQIYGVADFFIKKFISAIRLYSNGLVKFNFISSLPRYILETFLFLIVLATILTSIVFNWSLAKFIPMMTVMVIASFRFLPSINKIYTNLNLLHYSRNTLNIIWNIIMEDKNEPAP